MLSCGIAASNSNNTDARVVLEREASMNSSEQTLISQLPQP